MSDDTPKNSENFTADQRRLIAWLALPKADKSPKTQQAFAKEIGVHPDTLTDWKKLPGFMDEVQTFAKQAMRDDTAEVLGAIRRAAKQGSVPHINMFLAMTGLAADVAAAGKGPGDANGARNRLAALLEKRLATTDASSTTGDHSGA